MAVIDLCKRITYDWDIYNQNIKSHESFIYIKSNRVKIQTSTSINLTVGEEWFDSNKNTTIKIPSKGIKVRPGKYVVLITEQYLGVPYNVYGLVVGKGENIFIGGVISTGKIVPGYKGELKIGFYNTSDSAILLKRGDLLACCLFFDTESTLLNEEKEDRDERIPVLEYKGRWSKVTIFVRENWYNILSLILSLAAVLVAIFLKG